MKRAQYQKQDLQPIDDCFTMKRENAINLSRNALHQRHFEFLTQHIEKNGKDDEIVQILRNKPGTTVLLSHLVGQNGHRKLYDRMETIQKIIDPKCNINKNIPKIFT